MAVKKKSNYIDIDLDWAEETIVAWKSYIDAHPLHKLKDRKDGDKTVATIETQGKYIQETMRNCLALLGEIKALREVEDVKKSTPRGEQALSPMEERMI